MFTIREGVVTINYSIYYMVYRFQPGCTIQFTSTTRQGDVAKHLKKTFIFCPFRLAAMGKLFKVSTTSHLETCVNEKNKENRNEKVFTQIGCAKYDINYPAGSLGSVIMKHRWQHNIIGD